MGEVEGAFQEEIEKEGGEENKECTFDGAIADESLQVRGHPTCELV
jgi:hypothetical protein